MSQSFTDSFGREWKLALDPFLITKVCNEVTWKPKIYVEGEKSTDAKIGDVSQGVMLTEWSDHDFDLAQRLRVDMMLLVGVLWSLCEEQCEKNGCKEKAGNQNLPVYREFAAGLGGSVLLSAVEALEVAIINFSRSQAERESLIELKKKAKEIAEILQKRRMDEIQGVDVSQAAEKYMNSVLNLPESSESVRSPEALHSDN